MEIRFNVTGPRRREMVKAVSEIADWPAEYKGAPTFAYVIGDFTVDKEGTLSFSDMTDSELVENLIDGLVKRGFEFEEPYDTLTIEMPLEGFTDESIANLEKLIAGKANLIKKAIGADALPVERTETTLRFPWFTDGADPEAVKAYTRFVAALCDMARSQKRVTAKEKETGNDKYAFRCFLLRLGFVGDEYKNARKILLRNLSGNSAFKNGGSKTETEVSADE